MWNFRPPTDESLAAFRAEQAAMPLSYPESGATQGDFPAGYDHDRNEVCLGSGEEVFRRAALAIHEWKMFPAWTRIFPARLEPVPGATVVVVFRLLGYWRSSARIVYSLNESPGKSADGKPLKRSGFAYGTLPGHVETGEECFSVSLREDGRVFYELRAFSRPKFILARLFRPLARRWQRKFVRDSQAAMLAAVR